LLNIPISSTVSSWVIAIQFSAAISALQVRIQ
jgi:hypothetical protein